VGCQHPTARHRHRQANLGGRAFAARVKSTLGLNLSHTKTTYVLEESISRGRGTLFTSYLVQSHSNTIQPQVRSYICVTTTTHRALKEVAVAVSTSLGLPKKYELGHAKLSAGVAGALL
jgi:hypothetical protein